MMHPSQSPATHSMRIQAVINNPHITDWYFTSKLSDWVQHWLYKTLDAEWHWYRFEYQARGSTHAHGCAKLKNDPDICGLVKKAAAAWLLENSNDMPIGDDQDIQQILEEGKAAEKTALEYADWLVTTVNESMPDPTWRKPVPHPCAFNVTSVNDVDDEDYHNIVNTVQRHTKCSTAYCLKKRSPQQQLQCRFNFPHPEQLLSTIQFEQLENGDVRAVLKTKRNDPRINSHNRLLIQHWRANVDIQIIIDAEMCARYMAKYASKGEPRSQPVSSVFKSCVDRLNSTSHAHTALRSAMIRDFSAQETAHQLFSLPLFSCSFNFVALSLNGGSLLTTDNHSGEQKIEKSLVQHLYATRTNLPNINLVNFVSNYSVHNGQLHKRPSPFIVRCFPQFSSNPHDERYGQYCKYQLIKYKPWNNTVSNVWEGLPDADTTYIEVYESFLRTPEAAVCVPHFADELSRAEQRITENESSDSEDELPATEKHEQ